MVKATKARDFTEKGPRKRHWIRFIAKKAKSEFIAIFDGTGNPRESAGWRLIRPAVERWCELIGAGMPPSGEKA
ncbi:hypothetical protein KCP74_18770 [Salmonella enterica subsp. enterica]|nr:hypothetical protein KCP74_18770 [Salmonella enterica subsp. enterica]